MKKRKLKYAVFPADYRAWKKAIEECPPSGKEAEALRAAKAKYAIFK